MNLDYLLTESVQEFISLNFEKASADLGLKYATKFENWHEIANQLKSKQKAKLKLPTWFATPCIIYPESISVEQSSSEKTALYKSALVGGETLVDLTGGLGVDDYYFSKKVKTVYHCERNTDLSKIVAHNFSALNCDNVICITGDSHEFLKESNKKWDCIYIDPSRRDDVKGKVFLLEDCAPNVVDNLTTYLKYSNTILIKTSPIIDIHAGIHSLEFVKTIHIVAVENEVKELVWEIVNEYEGDIEIVTCNLSKKKTDTFCFLYTQSKNKNATYSLPKKFLYEPNAAIMKSGGFTEICSAYAVEKLHQHSHLYTSENVVDFPGRCFEIERVLPYKKKEAQLYLKNKTMNITTRNFPETVQLIKTKWNIKDGGSCYCFFTTDINEEKIIILCRKTS